MPVSSFRNDKHKVLYKENHKVNKIILTTYKIYQLDKNKSLKKEYLTEMWNEKKGFAFLVSINKI